MSDKNISSHCAETSRCADAVLEYLVANSELARSLDQPVTLEELLAHQTDFDRCVRLLAVLPKLEKDCFKPSNCLLDKTEPYDSLIGMSNADLVLLRELCEYFMVSNKSNGLNEKLDKVIKNGSDIESYKFMFCDGEEWIKIGDIRGFKWAYDHGARLDEDICDVAAEHGNLDCLEYLYKMGYRFDESTCAAAARVGNLECLKFLCESGCRWSTWTTICAAEGGHLDCLRYAREQDSDRVCPWDEKVCERAARGGHLECLKYAHTHGCPWDKYTCTLAAQSGHLDCLQYAHTHGCPWDEDVYLHAAYSSRLECLKYAHEHGCPRPTHWNPKFEHIKDSKCQEYIKENIC